MSFNYINSVTSVFPVIKNVVNYQLNKNFAPSLTSSGFPSLVQFVQTDLDWNKAVTSHQLALTGLFASHQMMEGLISTLKTESLSRWFSILGGVQRLSDNLASLQANRNIRGNTYITINGSSNAWIEPDPRYYAKLGKAHANIEKGIFELPSTGSFSAIRSREGSLVRAKVENTLLPPTVVKGDIQNTVDTDPYSTFYARFGAASLVSADPAITGWLPTNYEAGSCIQVTLDLVRPITFTEAHVNPMCELPQKVLALSWTPLGINHCIPATAVSDFSGWTFSNGATGQASGGVDNTYSIVIPYEETLDPDLLPVYFSKTIQLSTAYIESMTDVNNMPGSSYSVQDRLQVDIRAKTTGASVGCRVLWYNNTGSAIQQDYRESDYPGFYTTNSFVFYPPTSSASANIQIGNFSPDVTHTITVDKVTATFGEQRWNCNKDIITDTIIRCPLRINAQRVSFFVNQINPFRTTTYQPKTYNLPLPTSSSPINSTIYEYATGFKEFDLVNQEFLPRAALYSTPINPGFEIRRFWVDLQAEYDSISNIRCVFYPYANNLDKLVYIDPYILPNSSFNNQNFVATEGTIFEVVTTEEFNANFVLNDTNTNKVLVDPISISKEYDGTDASAELKLEEPVHIRKVRVKAVEDFLSVYGFYSTLYDPNANTVYGIAGTGSYRDSLQSNSFLDLNTIPASAVVTTEGYRPIEIEIATEQWSAFPDLYGQTVNFQVKTKTFEALTEVTEEVITTEINSTPISYEQWLSTTRVRDLNRIGVIGILEGLPFSVPNNNINATLKECLEFTKFRRGEDTVESWYRFLKNNNKLPNASTTSQKQETTRAESKTYQTEHKNIVRGPSGTFVKLYWATTSGDTIDLDPSQYEVDHVNGIIRVTASSPDEPAVLYADYTYQVPAQIGQPGSSSSLKLGQTSYMTRNITDYRNGSTPKFKAFQPNQLEPNYYPVIEYYLTPDSRLVFSTSFFKYGPTPAKIRVKYESLNIVPRIAAFFIRPSSPGKTPSLRSLSLGLESGAAAPTVEV